jgi:hypothetical protein
LNKLLKRQGLTAYLHDTGQCFVRNTGTGVDSTSISRLTRPLSKEEAEQRERLRAFLGSASEDEFTERVLLPLFQRLGFYRVSAAGHTEKMLEFGKDLWMKFQLPTSHWLYFCVQVKRDKIDSTGSSGGKNVGTILSQARMAIDHPIFDPEANRKVLLDHRVAISNSRLVALSEDNVTFRWRDSAHGNKKRLMTLPVEEFLRRFLLHLLPRGFMRIRNFGFLANRRRAERLRLCSRLLQQSHPPTARIASPALPIHSLWQCPLCGGTMHVVERLSAAATSPPISASSQPMYCMNPHLQPRISLVLRRAHWFCVSQLSKCSMVLRFRFSDANTALRLLARQESVLDHNFRVARQLEAITKV